MTGLTGKNRAPASSQLLGQSRSDGAGGVERLRELRHMVHLEGIRSADSGKESN